MTVLYLILPLALLFAAMAVAAFAWAVRSGQLDDVDTPPRRILFEDDRAEPARRAIDSEATHPVRRSSPSRRSCAKPWPDETAPPACGLRGIEP